MLTLIAVAVLATSPDLKVTKGTLIALDRPAKTMVVETPSGSVTFDVKQAVTLGDDALPTPLGQLIGESVQVWFAVEGAAVAREIDFVPLSPPPLVQAKIVDEQTVSGTLAAIDLWHRELVVTTAIGPVKLKLGSATPTAQLQLGMRIRATYVVEDEPITTTAIEVLGRPAPLPVS